MGLGGHRHAPTALPPRKTRYPLYRRLGGLQDRAGGVRKILPPTGFDPRTVQPGDIIPVGGEKFVLFIQLNRITFFLFLSFLLSLFSFFFLSSSFIELQEFTDGKV